MQFQKTKYDFSLWGLLLLAGIAGFSLGATYYGLKQTAVETAQVLSGIVQYPHDNPFYIYHVKLWSLIAQACAVLLYLGVDERTLNFTLSGIMGMLYFQTVALIVWGLSRRFFFSLFMPLIFFGFIKLDLFKRIGMSFDSAVYPIFIVGDKATYGGIGLLLVMATYALLGIERYGFAMFLAGLGISVHPLLGAFSFVVCMIALVIERKNPALPWKRIVAAAAAGLLISATSLLIQRYFYTSTISAPVLSAETRREILTAYFSTLAPHAGSVKIISWGVASQVVLIVFSGLWIRRYGERLSTGAVLMLKSYIAASVLSLILIALGNAHGLMPIEFMVMMPGRFQNILLLSFPAVAAGLLGLGNDRFQWPVLAAMLAAMLAVAYFRMDIDADIIPLAAVVGILLLQADYLSFIKSPEKAVGISNGFVFIVIILWLSFFTYVCVLNYHNMMSMLDETYCTWRNHEAYSSLHDGRGLVLSSMNIEFLQLDTRRPLVIEPHDPSTIGYAVEAAPAADYVFNKVYEIDMFDPEYGKLFRDSAAAIKYESRVWGMRTRAEWLDLAREFGFTNVVTTDNHAALDLPVEYYDRWHAVVVYGIPQ